VTSLGLAFAAAVVSGASALVYEVVWLRTLSLVVGHAVDALTAVLAAYMAGPRRGAPCSPAGSPNVFAVRSSRARGSNAAGSTAVDPATPTSARAAERGVPWCPRAPQGRYTVEVIARAWPSIRFREVPVSESSVSDINVRELQVPEDDVYAEFVKRDWCDGLPIVAPPPSGCGR
jgi:hypothetical protein